MKSLEIYTTDFIELEKSFNNWLERIGMSSNAIYAMPNNIREFFHFVEYRGITDLTSITGKHVEAFFEYLGNRPNERQGGGLSIAYLKKYLQSINKFYEYVALVRKIKISYEIRLEKSDKLVTEYLSLEEVKDLYEQCDLTTPYGIRDRCMLSIFYGCGLRRNEVLSLNLVDINFDRRQIHVRKGKGYKERIVPFPDRILHDIENYVDYGRPYLLSKNKTNPALFISQRGRRMEGESLMLRLKILLSRCEWSYGRKLGLHTLRHSISAHFLEGKNGEALTLDELSSFLGHSSADSTQIYSHISHGV